MHTKLKTIRIFIGVSEAQISSLLNVSCYKYRRMEDESLTISMENIFLLSCIFDIPIDYLIFDKYTIETIINSSSIQKLSMYSKDNISLELENNLLKHSSVKFSKATYRTIKKISQENLIIMSKFIYKCRLKMNLEIDEVANSLTIEHNDYCLIEQGKQWPSLNQILKMSDLFCMDIYRFFE